MRTPVMSRPRTHRLPLLLLVAATATLGACGADDDAPTAADPPPGEVERSEPTVVAIERSRYAPRSVTVAAGTEVTFRNLDPAVHTVTSPEDGAPFDSGDLGEGEELVVRLDEPGTYEYLCEIHPTMRGTVVVE